MSTCKIRYLCRVRCYTVRVYVRIYISKPIHCSLKIPASHGVPAFLWNAVKSILVDVHVYKFSGNTHGESNVF